MQPRIQGKSLLLDARDQSLRLGRVENEIPAMRRDDAGDQKAAMCGEKGIPERLLAGARQARMKPVVVGYALGPHNMDRRAIGNVRSGQHMWRHIQRRIVGEQADIVE